jgi:hypothetical protein
LGKFAGLVEYDGRDFAGWAAQPGLRTVEETLAGALGTVLRQPVRLTVAADGRGSGLRGLADRVAARIAVAIDADALATADAVVHLAGRSIDQGLRWTRKVKHQILQSRVRGTRLLAETMAARAGSGGRPGTSQRPRPGSAPR